MKKRLAALLTRERVKKHARFNAAYHDYQAATDALEKAKNERKAAKKAYNQLLKERRPDADVLFESLISLRKAKYLRQYQRAVFEQAEHRLRRIVEELERPAKTAAGADAKLKADKSAKEVPAGKLARSRKTAAGLAETSTPKPAKQPRAEKKMTTTAAPKTGKNRKN